MIITEKLAYKRIITELQRDSLVILTEAEQQRVNEFGKEQVAMDRAIAAIRRGLHVKDQ